MCTGERFVCLICQVHQRQQHKFPLFHRKRAVLHQKVQQTQSLGQQGGKFFGQIHAHRLLFAEIAVQRAAAFLEHVHK